ncbi:MAG: serine hydrolase [Pseudomonadota bacterium]
MRLRENSQGKGEREGSGQCRFAAFCLVRALTTASAPLLCLVLIGGGAQSAYALSPDRIATIDSILADLDSTHSPGCAVGVYRRGQLEFARGYGMASLEHRRPIGPDTVFYAGSVSKQFTAAAVLLAARDGHLALDDAVGDWFPELPAYADDIRVSELLHHTSGLRDYLTLMALAGVPFETPVEADWILQLVARQKATNFAPGTRFLYSNTGYILLAELIERATGRTLRAFAREKIFGPLGMTATDFHDDGDRIVTRRAPAYAREESSLVVRWSPSFDQIGSGGLLTTIEDLARWDRSFYDGRLGDDFWAAMQRTGTLRDGTALNYAAGLRVDQQGTARRIQHGGAIFGYRAMLSRFPESELTVALLCNLASADPGRRAEAIAAALIPAAQADAVLPQPDVEADEPVPADDPQAGAGWVGSFHSEELNATATIRRSASGYTYQVGLAGTEALTFRRDGTAAAGRLTAAVSRAAGDQVQAFTIDAGRVLGIEFERQSAPRLVLRGGHIFDGSGNPWYRGDVAIEGERIVAVGRLDDQREGQQRIVDVSGYIVAPGFIDTHSHAGPGLATPELSGGAPLLTQGITTVFINPDGAGAVDLAAQREALERDGLGLNVAQFVPHGAVRKAIMGLADRPPTTAELEQMRVLVRAGMAAGAWGLSSGPFYAPGSYSSTDELVALARVAAGYGGAYQSHVRDESDYGIGLMAALNEVITVAREAGLPGVHTHVKALGPPVWGFAQQIVEAIEQARAAGIEVYADRYPYLASATSLGAALLPRWAQAGGPAALRERLGRPDDLSRIRGAIQDNLARRGGAERIQFRRVAWDSALEGRRLSEVAQTWEVDVIDAVLRVVRAGGAGIVSFNMSEDDVRTLMRQPWTMTACDGGLVPLGQGVPHPRGYGTFPRKLRRFVLEDEVLTLEDAIRTMTALPAQVYRMPDRGLIARGKVADLVVLDPSSVGDRATFTRPHQLSTGVVHLLIGGVTVIEEGELTGRRPGAVLQRPGSAY